MRFIHLYLLLTIFNLSLSAQASDPITLQQQAFDAYKQKKYDLAIQRSRELLAKPLASDSLASEVFFILAKSYEATVQWEPMIEAALHLDSLEKRLKKLDPTYRTIANYLLGYGHTELGMREVGITYYLQALEEAPDDPKFGDGVVPVTYNNLGFQYLGGNEAKKALPFLEKAYALWKIDPGPQAKNNIVAILGNIARAYMDLYQVERAKYYSKEAIRKADLYFEVDSRQSVNAKGNYALILTDLNEFEAANAVYLEIESTLGQVPPKTKSSILGNWGLLLRNKGYFEEAEDKLWAAANTDKLLLSKENPSYIGSLINLAGLNFRKGTIDQVLPLLSEADSLANIYDSPHRATIIGALGLTFSKLNQPEVALDYVQKALSISTQSPYLLEDSVYSNPPIQKLIIGKNTPHANYLKFKAEAAWNLYEQNPDQAYLRIAQEAYALLHQLIQKSFREADLTESSSLQSTLAFTMDGILKTGLAYQELSQPENLNTVFEYLQKSKGLSINLNLGRDFQEIDTLLIQVRSEITALEKQIFWTQQGAQDFNLDSLNEQLIAKYDQLKLRENDSNNSLVETINVKTLQQELKENQLFLELYQAASGVYTLAVHRNGIRLFHQPNPENLNVLLQNSRKGLSDWSWIKLNQDSSRQYIYEAGRLAYTSSLADALEWFPAVQKIVLAPSNQLANLPYAIALPTAFDYQSQSFQDWPFLLKSRSLGYAYSATIWLRQRNQNRAFRRAKMAVFAPAYEDNTTSDDELVANLQRSGNWQLPFAQLEAKEISTLMGAKLYQGAKASRLF